MPAKNSRIKLAADLTTRAQRRRLFYSKTLETNNELADWIEISLEKEKPFSDV